jgi:uncharacterized protein (DUF1697 family)
MQHVALLRGVNVGGVKLLMADLRAAAEGLGWGDVKSYIASGNLLFRAEGQPAALAAHLTAALAARIGRGPDILVLTADAFRAALGACPFDPARGKDVHGFFLFGPVTVDAARRDALIAPSETMVLQQGMIWLSTPEGFGTSKLAEKWGQVVRGGPATARNLATIRALAEMLD